MKAPNITETITPILKQYAVSKAALFGSYARDDYTEKSDVDLVVDISFEHCLDVLDLYEQLENTIQKKVDIITLYTLEQGSLTDPILNNIRKDLRWFYES
ncbi:MAG: nucleotidyltransferase domain-containing protein [Defluviitaleaceae bacterium]|nr:nucleotidyltransferase domain-containing protein [Defluviitaleaceae bacterium]